jgi:hypothetical protein
LSLFLVPIPKFEHAPFTPEVLRVKEHTPTPSSIVFIFGLTFESFKECGGASLQLTLLECSENFNNQENIFYLDFGRWTSKDLLNQQTNYWEPIFLRAPPSQCTFPFVQINMGATK